MERAVTSLRPSRPTYHDQPRTPTTLAGVKTNGGTPGERRGRGKRMSTNILPATTAPLNSTSPPDTLRPHIHAVSLDQYYCRTARDPQFER